MRRISLPVMATALVLILGSATAQAAPAEKEPGEGKDLYEKDFTG